ncbi:YDG/SRA domain-containing protein [Streptomyces sp. DH24]|uniref:YDG/SRA domain-containing protein n=1 Tax=Streptomyces sp. DH24 TaxID=3040123 RepID=UPI0024434982|nr:YDG/SRA domain-containing protein [Streptomyces sp. DH24]MDG9720398.1 YDG/SRA domain-containing protein [Streptomyces sp. DH24]
MEIERVGGHVRGVPVGAVFAVRKEVQKAKLHRDNQRGISWVSDEDGLQVGDAIVLHGGYEDDQDEWETIQYTGASPSKDRDPKTKKLLRSQSWTYLDNAALLRSYQRGYHIRVIRGYKGDARYSPSKADGYRYDGLYRITAARTATSKSPAPDGSEIQICQFDLERLPEDQQVQTDLERQIIDALDESAEQQEKFPRSRSVQVRRLVRDTAAVRRIKSLYEGECQLCGLRLEGPDGKPYSEGAHIRPLGKPHHGPDVEPNILCLCPNCHVRLDIGAVVVDHDWSVVMRAGLFGAGLRTKLLVKKGHRVHPEYLRYHRDYWSKRGVGSAS